MCLFLRPFSALGGRQLFALLGAAMVGVGSVAAATITVTTTNDSGPGSLRQALAGATDGDTIQFDAALNGQTIALISDELVIDKNITISGPGPNLLAVSRQASIFRIFHVMPGHTVMMEGLTISGGYVSASFGGGIYNESATLTIVNSTVSGNLSGEGGGAGGIYNRGSSAILTIINSTISGNSAPFDPAHPGGYGGGILSGGTLTIINSTISGNLAGIAGGGVLTGGASATLTMSNSTVSGNTAGANRAGTGWGGGIDNSGILVITNSTLSGNTANGASLGGGIYNDGTIDTATVEIGNIILNAGASGANISNNSGTVTSHGYNLSSDNGGGFLSATGDQINTNPMLGSLQDNGGPTFTHALLVGSPAIDAGDPNFTPPPFSDQRGPSYDRVFNGRIDIGSFEVQPDPTPTPTPTPTATATATPTATATATPPATPTPSPTATPSPSPAQALNISTRLRVETGDNVMIGGFIITGSAPKNVAVRGIGPSLAAFGISDALLDPTIEVRAANGTLIVQNDNWQDDPAQATQLTALGLAPQDPRESGIVTTLQPGASYTAILAGKNNGTGVGLVEVYDADSAAASRLANISTRGFVRTSDNVMIGGFILGNGSASAQVVVRGIGPSLSQSGLSDVLEDPTLELHNGNGTLLIANDNWQDDPVSAAQLSVHSLAPGNSLESGIFSTLPPGAFTAILAGKDGGVGVGLVEVYNIQ